jgi:hypothetical protein
VSHLTGWVRIPGAVSTKRQQMRKTLDALGQLKFNGCLDQASSMVGDETESRQWGARRRAGRALDPVGIDARRARGSAHRQPRHLLSARSPHVADRQQVPDQVGPEHPLPESQALVVYDVVYRPDGAECCTPTNCQERLLKWVVARSIATGRSCAGSRASGPSYRRVILSVWVARLPRAASASVSVSVLTPTPTPTVRE